MMKKTGLLAGISFFAGALFVALFFGHFQGNEPGRTQLEPSVAYAQSQEIKQTGGSVDFVPLVKKVRPAVVKVIAEITPVDRGMNNELLDPSFHFNPDLQPVPGMGSGFFISPDGYLITNNHVVNQAVKIRIKTIDETEYTAHIIGTDPRTDLALLKIDVQNLPQNLTFIELGDSNQVEVGEWVLAIGNPLDQDLSVSAGIISAKGRQLGVAEYEDFLQTDAAINKGNSGGPLVNVHGKVIGITSVILAPSGVNIGIGFAIPANMAQKVVRDLKSRGRVVRGHLGIRVQFLNTDEARDLDFPVKGSLVTKVEEHSPAARAGLKKYDLIVEVDGKSVKTNNDLAIRIAEANPGDEVQLTVYREKKKITIKVKVGEAPDTIKFKTQGKENRSIDLGMVLEKNSTTLARENGLATTNGILVTRVEITGPAAENGIRELDVILEINGKTIHRVADFQRIIANKNPGSLLLLFINRGGEEEPIRFRLPQ